METKLKYTLIKSRTQYDEYCERIHDLLFDNREENTHEEEDEIDLLTMLIERWDDENSTLEESDPIQLIAIFMEDWKYTPESLANEIGLCPKKFADIMDYKRGLSKEAILAVANRFKIRKDAINKPYELRNHPLFGTEKKSNAEIMNTVKALE